MKLYIEVENGNAIQHPAFEDNLNQAFPEGIPNRFEPFERIGSELPVDTFQKSVCTYVKNENGIWNDVWSVVDMTDEEKQVKIDEIKLNVNKRFQDNFRLAQVMVLRCTADSDLNGVNVWNNYINICKLWNLESVLPTTPPIPRLPIRNESGNWELVE